MSQTELPYTLGLDLDGVCGEYIPAFRDHVARYKNIDGNTIPDPKTWDFVEAGWPIEDAEEFRKLHSDAVKDGLYRSMMPMPGVSEALWKLNDLGVHIRVITHRLIVKHLHFITASDTVMWLDRHKIPYRDLCFAGAKTQVNADIYIDDGPHNVELLRGVGAKVIVFDAPYNKDLEGPRVSNWEQAYRIIARDWAEKTHNPIPEDAQ